MKISNKKYILLFLKKQELGEQYIEWLNEHTVAFANYYVDIKDIIFDVESKQEKDVFFEYYDYVVENEITDLTYQEWINTNKLCLK